MPVDLNAIETIVVVLMENRSFDHMLGYLSLKRFGGECDVDGLKEDPDWLSSVANLNPFDGKRYQPLPLSWLQTPDQPHERGDVAIQLGDQQPDGAFKMDGFIASAGGRSEVMQYYTPRELPVTDFFARNFGVCDRWFAPLPAGTQPNRLMAMSGYSMTDVNLHELEKQNLVYEWLTAHGVRWRVYHEWVPFFTLMPDLWGEIAGDNFRRFDRFAFDLKDESDATFPQVVFVEPTYIDAPHLGLPSDDHPPSSVAWGQAFLQKVYLALTGSSRWSKSVLIITYDEHGGWFDHVSPIELETVAPSDNYPVFETSGVRVPGIVISPFVDAGIVFHDPLDHTSILKFLAQKFGDGSYSADVDKRSIRSVAEVLNRATARTEVPSPPSASTLTISGSTNAVGMQRNVAKMAADPRILEKFPELKHLL